MDFEDYKSHLKRVVDNGYKLDDIAILLEKPISYLQEILFGQSWPGETSIEITNLYPNYKTIKITERQLKHALEGIVLFGETLEDVSARTGKPLDWLESILES
ncbi:MAG: hypothetical protein KGN01_05815 [Patescibacteria group bacterium]|nr:hypothetical protein [Patescibacteria group bacterium]